MRPAEISQPPTYKLAAEIELVRSLISGDNEAAERFRKDYLLGLITWIRCRGPSEEDAKDIGQELLLKVLEGYWHARGPLLTWLYCAARNLIVDCFRRSRSEEKALKCIQKRENAGEDPLAKFDNLERLEEFSALHAEISKLPSRRRDVLIYEFFSGLSPAEIAGVFSTTTANVATVRYRALQQLRSALTSSQLLGGNHAPFL